MNIERTEVESACPSCGVVAKRMTYDIGSGSELSCANCEWCWGADGQQLKPLNLAEMTARARNSSKRDPSWRADYEEKSES